MDDKFIRFRKNPIYWFNKASDLRAAAGAVWVAMLDRKPDPRLGLPAGFAMDIACPLCYRMLCGLALELCLNAIIVASARVPPRTHSLEKLSLLAKVQYDPPELALLRVLADAVVWVGRYPLPNGGDESARRRYDEANASAVSSLFDRSKMGTLDVRRPNNALDWTGFKQLWERASQHYWQLHRSG